MSAMSASWCPGRSGSTALSCLQCCWRVHISLQLALTLTVSGSGSLLGVLRRLVASLPVAAVDLSPVLRMPRSTRARILLLMQQSLMGLSWSVLLGIRAWLHAEVTTQLGR